MTGIIHPYIWRVTLFVLLLGTGSLPAWGGNVIDIAPRIYGNDTLGVSVTGEPWSVAFDIDAEPGFTPYFPTDAKVLQVDLPPGLEVVAIDVSSVNDFSDPDMVLEGNPAEEISCQVDANLLLCVALAPYNGYLRIRLRVSAPESGAYRFPAEGGACLADPDQEVDEAFEDNNDCSFMTDEVAVRPAPESLANDWLQVTMWDGFARAYDANVNGFSGVQPTFLENGDGLHTLNEVVRHPHSGVHYVLYRPYRSATHSLGTYSPSAGVSDIGPTGQVWHDAAFSDDGQLFAVERDGRLFSLDIATGAATALCDTGFGNDGLDHSALAFDSNNHRLLQLTNYRMHAIDTVNLPLSADDPCVFLDRIPVGAGGRMDYRVFAAAYADGLVYVADSYGALFAVRPDGGALLLHELPQHVHGIVPDPGGIEPATTACPLDLYTTLSQGGDRGRATPLFTLASDNAALRYITSLPYSIVYALEYDPVSGALYGTGSTPEDGAQVWFSADACSGEVLTEVPASEGRVTGLDIRGPTLAFAHKRSNNSAENGLYEVNLDTGDFTPVALLEGATSKASDAFMIRNGDSVVLAIGEEWLWVDLNNYDQKLFQSPMNFGPGLERGQFRRMDSWDLSPDQNLYYGLLLRATSVGGINSSNSRANALVTVDASGNVELVGALPAGLTTLTGAFNEMFNDSFEGAEKN